MTHRALASASSPPRGRRLLLCGTAVVGVAALMSGRAAAQQFPDTAGALTAGSGANGNAPVLTPNGNTLEVTLDATRSYIDWKGASGFTVKGASDPGGEGTVLYKFANPNDVVLNRADSVTINGQVLGRDAAGATRAGNIWFYSTGGVLVGADATLDANGFLFARGAGIDLNSFLNPANNMFDVVSTASNALLQIDTGLIATTATIDGSGAISLVADAGTDLSFSTLDARSSAGGITLSTSGAGKVTAANATLTTTMAGGDISVTSESTIDLSSGTVASVAGVSITSTGAGGDVTVKNATAGAGEDVTVSSTSGAVLLNEGAAGQDIVVTSAAAAQLDKGTAVRDILVQGASAQLGPNAPAGETATAGRDITVQGDTTTAKVTIAATAGRDVLVKAKTDATVTSTATAGDDVAVTATDGSVNAGAATLISTGQGTDIEASGRNVTVTAATAGKSATVGSASTGTGAAKNDGDVVVNAATATLNGSSATRDVLVTSTEFNATLTGTNTAGRDVTVTGKVDASLSGTVTAGDDVTVTATTGSVTAGAAALTSTGEGTDIEASGRNVTVTAATAGKSATVGSASTGTGAAKNDGDVVVNAATATLNGSSATRDILVTATNGDASIAGTNKAGRDATVSATNDVSLTGLLQAGRNLSVSADRDVVVTSAADAELSGSYVAVRDVTVTAAGNVNVGASSLLQAGDDVTVKATTGSVAAGSATLKSTGAAADADGSVTVTALAAGKSATVGSASTGTGDPNKAGDVVVKSDTVTVNAAAATRDVTITATNGDANLAGTFQGGDDVTVTATGGDVKAGAASLVSTGEGTDTEANGLRNVTVTAATAGKSATVGSASTGTGLNKNSGDVVVTADTATLNGSSATRDVIVTANNGDATLSGTNTAGRDGTVTAANDVKLSGTLQAGDDLTVSATGGSVAAATATLKSTGLGTDTEADGLRNVSVQALTGGKSASVGSASTGTGDANKAGDVVVKSDTVTVNAAAATRDVTITATNGNANLAGTISAGDDVTVSATGGDVAGPTAILTSTGAGDDSEADGLRGVSVTALTAGKSVTLSKASTAALGDITLKADTAVTVGDPGNAATDLVLDSFRDVSITADGAITVNGKSTARRDLAAVSANSTVKVGDFLAFDDVLLGSKTGITAAGQITAGAGAGDDTDGAADLSTLGHMDGANVAARSTAGGFDSKDVSAIRDIGIGVAGGDIQVTGSLQAQDDVVLRSDGLVKVTGAIATGITGATAQSADGNTLTEAGDRLANDVKVMPFGTAAHKLHGHDVDVAGDTGVQLASVTTVIAGATDTSSSDVRLTAKTGGVATSGTVRATRDIAIDSNATVSVTDALKAGGQIGVRSVTADVATKDIQSGSKVAGGVFVYGATDVTVGGSVTVKVDNTSDLAPTQGDETAVRPATTLAGIYTFCDFIDDLSCGVPIGDLSVDGSATIRAGGNIEITGDVDVDIDARVRADGTITVAVISAGQEIALDGFGNLTATGALTATTRDVGVLSRTGAVNLMSDVTAGDDVVLRGGSINVTGMARAGADGDVVGVGDALVTARGPVVFAGLSFTDLTGSSDVDALAPGSVTLGGAVAPRDVRAQSTGAGVGIGSGGADAGRDILLDAATTVATSGLLDAGRDVAVKANGAIDLGFTLVGSENQSVQAGDDVVVRSGAGDITVRGTIKTTGANVVDPIAVGDVLFAAVGSSVKDAMGVDKQVFDLSRTDVDVKSTTGAIDLQDKATSATGDVRVLSGGDVKVADIVAGQDVFLDGKTVTAKAATIISGRDVAVRGTTAPMVGSTVTLAGVTATDDVFVRALAGDVALNGAITSGTGANVDTGVADSLLAATAPVQVLTTKFTALKGGDIDVVAAGSITGSSGAFDAKGAESDLRLSTTGALSVINIAGAGGGKAGRDVLLDSKSVTTGSLLKAGRDIGVRATTGVVSLGAADADGTVVLRAPTSVTVNGATRAGGASSGTEQAAALIFSEQGGTPALAAGDVDVMSGSITMTGQVTAALDVRLNATGAVTATGGAGAGRDVLLTGGSVTAGGALTAGGDVKAVAGGSADIGSATAGVGVLVQGSSAAASGALSAGMDVKVIASGGSASTAAATAGGSVIIQGSSALASGALEATTGDVKVTASGGSASTTDVTASRGVVVSGAGSVTTTGTLKATSGNVTVTASGGTANVESATAGLDVLITASGNITQTGTLGGRDIGVRSGGTIQVKNATATDDVFLSAATGLKITGAVGSSGGADAPEGVADVMLDQDAKNATGLENLSGPMVVLFTKSGDTKVGAMTSKGDVMLMGDTVTATGDLSSERDIAVMARTGSVTLESASARDDIVIRSGGDITVNGTLTTKGGEGSDVLGAADRHIGQGNSAVGSVIDVRSPQGEITVAGVTSGIDDVRFVAGKAGAWQELEVAGVTSSRGDIFLQGSTALVKSSLTAGRDVTVDAKAAPPASGLDLDAQAAVAPPAPVTLQINDKTTAARNVTFTAQGGIVAAGAVSGVAVKATSGSGNLTLTGGVTGTGAVQLTGNSVSSAKDITSGSTVVTAKTGSIEVVTVTGTSGEVRLEAASTVKATGSVTAATDVTVTSQGVATLVGVTATTGDVSIDAGSVTASKALSAGRDAAVRGTSEVTLANVTSGDDVLVQSSGKVKVGTISAVGTDRAGQADTLIGPTFIVSKTTTVTVDPATLAATTKTTDVAAGALPTGNVVHLRGSSIDVGGATAGGMVGSASVVGEIRLHATAANGSITAGALTGTGGSIFARATDLNVGAAWTAGRIQLETTRTDGFTLGGAGATALLDSTEFSRLSAGTIDVYAGSTAGNERTKGTIEVGDLKIGDSSVSVFAGSGITVTVKGTVQPTANGKGSLRIGAPSTESGTAGFMDNWTPSTIHVLADTGSIGVGAAARGPGDTTVTQGFNAVELNAINSIYLATGDFRTTVETLQTALQVFQANGNAVQNPGVARAGAPAAYVAAVNLALRANQRIVGQNTSGAVVNGGLASNTGLIVGTPANAGRIAIGRTGSAPPVDGNPPPPKRPDIVDLYGVLGGDNTFLGNDQVGLSARLGVLVDRSQFYRFNNCVIGEAGNCAPITQPNVDVRPEQLTNLNLDDRDDEDVVPDPTVASAGNEEIWKDPE